MPHPVTDAITNIATATITNRFRVAIRDDGIQQKVLGIVVISYPE